MVSIYSALTSARAWTVRSALPRTVVSVSECDSLRDEELDFYRPLLAAGVPSRCVQLMGMVYAIEVDTLTCPDVSREAAGRVAGFARGTE